MNHELVERWDAAQRVDFAVAWRRAEEDVVTWVWADGPLDTPVPFGEPVFGLRGRRLPNPPDKPRDGLFLLGYDALGRLRAFRQYIDQGGNRPLADWSTVVDHAEHGVSWIEYGAEPSRKPRHVSHYVTSGNQLVSYEVLQRSTHEVHHYQADERGRVTAIKVTHTLSWRAKPRKRSTRRSAYSLFYSGDDLVGVDRDGVALFRTPAKGALDDLVEEFVALMVVEVPRRVRVLTLDAPLADLAVVFWPGPRPLPPMIAASDEVELQALRVAGLHTAPSEKRHCGNGCLADPAGEHRLLDLALTLNKKLSTRDMLRALREVVRRLRALPATTWPETTPDFAIYLCGMAGRVDHTLGYR